MYLDDIAVGIVEEDLVPAIDRALTPVGIGNTPGVEMRLESLEVIAAIGDMPAFHRIDDQAGAKSGLYIASGKMDLDRTIRDKGHIAGIAPGLFKNRQPLGLAIKPHDVLIETVHRLDIGC